MPLKPSPLLAEQPSSLSQSSPERFSSSPITLLAFSGPIQHSISVLCCGPQTWLTYSVGPHEGRTERDNHNLVPVIQPSFHTSWKEDSSGVLMGIGELMDESRFEEAEDWQTLFLLNMRTHLKKNIWGGCVDFSNQFFFTNVCKGQSLLRGAAFCMLVWTWVGVQWTF